MANRRGLTQMHRVFVFFLVVVLSVSSQKDLVKEADLLLDMMEYDSALEIYKRALTFNTKLKDIRKKMAYAHLQLDQIDQALSLLREELILFPENEDAYNLLAYIVYRQNELDRVDDFLEEKEFPIRLTDENPGIGGLAWFILGKDFKERKNYPEAEKSLKKAVAKGYNPVQCYVQLIDLELLQSNLGSAENLILEANKICGLVPELHFLQGVFCLEKLKTLPGDFIPQYLRLALDSFRMAAEGRPDFNEAIFNLASVSYEYNEFAQAAKYFEELLQLDPTNAELKFYLDCCLKKLGQSVEIEKPCPSTIGLSREFIDKPSIEYSHIFNHDKNFVLANINYLGLDFIRNGKYRESIKRFRNGLKIYPECPEINFNLGMVYRWLGQSEDAEKHALMALRRRDFFGQLPASVVRKIKRERNEFLKRGPQIPVREWNFEAALKEGNFFLDTYDLLGTIYFERGNVDSALLAFQKVVDINEEDAPGHFNLGRAYLAMGDKRRAEEEWRKAIRYEEKLQRARETTKLSKDELQVSLVIYRRPVSFQAHMSLAEMYKEQGRFEEAMIDFEEAIDLAPGDPEPYYELGKLRLLKGDKEKAVFYFDKYLYLGGKEEAKVKKILKSLKEK